MEAPESLVVDLLNSLQAGPRRYDAVMDAWRTSCPRLPVWEDAVDLGLVRRDGHDVLLTDAGRQWLATRS